MTITFDEAVARVSAVVAERPEFIYQTATTGDEANSCRYFRPDGTPDCLIGVAFAEELNAADVILDRNTDSVGELIDYGVLNVVEYRARDFLDNIQSSQDSGDSWASAFSQAIDYDHTYHVA